VPITTDPHPYQSFGRTRSGSRRYRCKACRGTFAIGRATTGHKQPHKNRTVFALLMNKAPIRRICEVTDLTADALYGKIDFLFRQCQAFAAEREHHLQSGFPIRRLYLGVDRQDYVVNWTRQEDRRNLVLHAVGAADNGTGYVFGMHLNYDPSLDADTLESQAKSCGDLQPHPPFRRYARCWLAADYEAAVRRQTRRRRRKPSLPEAIQDTYAEALEREDVEVFEAQAQDRRLPTKGVQIHAEYTLYGHFFYLRHLLPGVEKFRFFLDQDSGMRAAVAASRREFRQAQEAHPDLSDTAVKLLLIKEQLEKMASFGRWQDKWMMHPFPTLSEPKKAVCHLTDYGDYDADHLAWLYNKASLHAITCFFMQVRRRLSLLERPLATTSNFGRRWYGYSPYNPENITKLLTIFRVFYNYCLAGAGGNTPAMRLGLANRKIALEDIIYF
jgi:transposase-like protein